MIECPVCGSAVLGQPDACGVCGTPLGRSRKTGGGYQQFLPLVLPGLSHLWRGYLLRGSMGLFGTFTALLWLLAKLQRASWSLGTALVLAVWAVLWTVWSLSWHWDRLGLATRRPSAGRVVSSVLVLLVLANVGMFALVIGMFSEARF